MRKLAFLNLAVAIALLAGIIVFHLGQGTLLVSEKTFIAGLHNSLGYLDLAKEKWATEKNKSEQDIPTLEDLMPYMKDNRRRIERFMALGINYKITSTEESQLDVATLTRDLRFRRGYCLLYRAGSKFNIRTGWSDDPPPYGITSTHHTLYFKNNLDHLLEAAFLMLIAGNLVVFCLRKSNSINTELPR